MEYRLLGPLEVWRDGVAVDLGGPQQRAVLAALLLEPNRPVSVDALAGVVWGDVPPASWPGSLQVLVSNLRRVLRDASTATSPIVRQAPGYRLVVDPSSTDVQRFTAAAAAAAAAVADRAWQLAVDAAREALGLWRGPLLADLADEPWVAPAARAHEERRADGQEHLVTGLLGLGAVTDAVAAARDLAAEQPLRERAMWLLAVALHRAGRTAEALDVLRAHADELRDELGLDPGPSLRRLHGAILRQDPAVAAWPGDGRADTDNNAPVNVAQDSRRASDPTSDDVLVGRGPERAALRAVLDDAGTGARWAVLTGPAGIGKTRLAEDVAATAAAGNWRVVRARCAEDDGAPAWWPVRQLLTDLGADADTLLATPEGVGADAARFAVHQRVAAAFTDRAATPRLLVLVDDVQWADPASLRLLGHLAETVERAGLAFVLTLRDGAWPPLVTRLLATLARRPGTRQLTVPPLSAPEVAELTARVSGSPVDADQAAALAVRTSGNPFFVGEYARLPAAARGRGETPVAVRSVLAVRLTALDPDVLDLMRTAAVVGDTIDVDLLGEVSGLDRDEVADRLDAAADEHLIVTGSTTTYVLAHALLRDELVAGLRPVRRQRLHARVAAALESRGGPDRSARRAAHLVAALPLADPAEVFAACTAAAAEAEQAWQSDAAAWWWGQALTVFDALPPRAPVTVTDRDELVIAHVDALARAGRGRTALEVVDSALLEAVRHGHTDSAGRLAGVLLRTTGSWPWAVYAEGPAPLLTRLAGLETLVADDPGAHVRITAALAVGSCYDADPGVPDTLSRRAVDEAEALGDPDVLADALLGRALTYSGVAERAEESRALLERLLALPHRLQRSDDVLAHGMLFLATMCLGDPAAAAHARAAAVGSDLLRLPVSRAQVRWAEAELAHWRGDDPDGVEQAYHRARQLHAQTELYETGVHSIAMLTLRWQQGRLADDPELARTDPAFVPWAPAVLAVARADPAADALLAAEIARPEVPMWITHGRLTMLAHAVADAGLRHHVATLRPRLEPLAHCVANIGVCGVAGPVGLAVSRLCLLDGDHEAARTHLDTARRVSERAGGRSVLARLQQWEQVLADAGSRGARGAVSTTPG